MNTNVNLEAPVAALALLGAGFLVFVAAAVLVQSLIVRKRKRARLFALVLVAIFAIYLGAMLAFSMASHEKVLARGQEKHFCELDCHLAYSILNVRQEKTVGNGANQSNAQGVYTVITVRTRFDETTISSRRGNGLLTPNPRSLTLLDDRGNRYVLASQNGTPLPTSLRPGESYTTDLAFDLPADARPSILLINESDWISRFVIGHENSPLHQKTKFQI